MFVWGSNDYFAPIFKNPLRYLTGAAEGLRTRQHKLPWEDLGHGFTERGWLDLTHERAMLEIRGVRFGFRGTDDAHLGQDHYSEVAGPIDRDQVDVALGVTHAPYRRVLDAMTSDGHDLILAGHTHGGQVCVPGLGALVTNCDLDAARAKGLSTHSAGRADRLAACLGGSGHLPVRAGPLRLPARGHPAHPDRQRRCRLRPLVGGTMPPRCRCRNRSPGRRARRWARLSEAQCSTGCGAAW